MRKPLYQRVIGYVVLIFFLVVILLPFYWMFVTSFEPQFRHQRLPASVLPASLDACSL
ncbi:binding-protein-dependent transport systems inner membrane component [Alicyclobacillus acidocaldarius subsp. acidocaldarius Tc-4-1]|uniref:Binding-protein-dependent transport systems inner membrane component n=1 Tax=Alicyclobacillus acidocaldarius (strain Tc-4-1) TaxID=1048834 RepID=F8IGI2_ALIAT|nr:binding-protein-dependent transport systems inner membrane component [Alicyclobacillus acidocaldarius subsp. acidocaldarius Tc-4-1]